MYPTGTRVTVRSIDHLAKPEKKQHLLGKTGTVIDHENGMNIVADLTWHDWATGLHVFADDDLEAVGNGSTPHLPPVNVIRSYHAPNE